MNQDLSKERNNSTLHLAKLKKFIGKCFLSSQRYDLMLHLRDKISLQIKPLFEENYNNLDRTEKYEMVMKKSLEIYDFVREHSIDNEVEFVYLVSSVLGSEKQLFGLHITMFKYSLDLWSTAEQRDYWTKFMNENVIFGSYVQTELGHGTYLRGLETTATYDKRTQEFVIDSPTLTSIKYWPGSSGKSCNFAIVMAKLVVDNKEHGIHAFVVQLRSLVDHRPVEGLEVGDIGRKYGYDPIDNGYMKFNKVRIPRHHMLMRFAQVTPDGKFERLGSELLMYACMLVTRSVMCNFASTLLAMSTTIAIRYSCVRRQSPNLDGGEFQVIDYKTQQYRLFPALATTYNLWFSTMFFRNFLIKTREETNFFKNIKPDSLAKLHALSSGLKSIVFDLLLKFSQSNRLCCGGHGYSASSGLSQIIQEADAGCTYEGDNIVLYLQTARYLLKCAQKGVSPHLELPTMNEIKSSKFYANLQGYIHIYNQLFEKQLDDISKKLLYLVSEKNMSEYDAWNSCTIHLITLSKSYIYLFMIYTSFDSLVSYSKSEDFDQSNLDSLVDLAEVFLIYGLLENFPSNILAFELVNKTKMDKLSERLDELFKKLRVNSVSLVDAFDFTDANLCSSLGVYNGNVYEQLLDFAKKSTFNQKEVPDAYHKHLKPYMMSKKAKL